jgi:hypothetical protein
MLLVRKDVSVVVAGYRSNRAASHYGNSSTHSAAHTSTGHAADC